MLTWTPGSEDAPEIPSLPPLRGLSFLDRFLVVWIILAMAIGIVLGNTVSSVGPALQKGEFVGVSIPIGKFDPISVSRLIL
jgi:ACR3 family arsenite transporter